MTDDLLIVGPPFFHFFVLKDATGLYLIDTGFVNGARQLHRALKRRGWDRLPIRGILLTHGHIDHTFNAVRFAEPHGAWIAAPRLDMAGCLGTARYTGIARVTNFLEAAGRRLFGYRPFTPSVLFDPGTEFPVWHGLRAVPLPGHTAGHTGFLCEKLKLLFTGDLFSSCLGLGVRPPPIFNAHPEQIPASIAAAASLDLEGVLPNHADDAPPDEHLRRLRALDARLSSSTKVGWSVAARL